MSVRIPTDCSCPACRRAIDAATSTRQGQSAMPKAGDWSVCMYCSVALVYDSDLGVRIPAPGEFETLSPRQRTMIAYAQMAVLQIHGRDHGAA